MQHHPSKEITKPDLATSDREFWRELVSMTLTGPHPAEGFIEHVLDRLERVS